MGKETTPANALTRKNLPIVAGTVLYGVAKRNRGARIRVLEDQAEQDGRLNAKTITGFVILEALGSAGKKYYSLRQLMLEKQPVSVEFCDAIIQGQRDFMDKQNHHLFRLNGYALRQDLTANEKESFQYSVSDDAKKQQWHIDKLEREQMAQDPGDIITQDDSGESVDTGVDPLEDTVAQQSVADILIGTEGRLVLTTHYRRERDPKLVREAKDKHLRRDSLCRCECCQESMLEHYGVNTIEAHHQDPIGEREGERETTSDDFDLLCPNCHRALHRLGSGAILADLKEVLRFHREKRKASSGKP